MKITGPNFQTGLDFKMPNKRKEYEEFKKLLNRNSDSEPKWIICVMYANHFQRKLIFFQARVLMQHSFRSMTSSTEYDVTSACSYNSYQLKRYADLSLHEGKCQVVNISAINCINTIQYRECALIIFLRFTWNCRKWIFIFTVNKI
jgi:hypothetical protein